MIEPPPKLPHPSHLPEDNWKAIEAEETRFRDAFEANDMSAIVGGMKCLAESVGRVTMELAGKPLASGASYEQAINGAHNELKMQRGHDLSTDGEVGKMADWAKKMAANLGNLRNDMGTGHGRSRLPEVTEEAVRLSVEGGMMWVRWALTRLDWFVFGRPTQLMDDLLHGGLFGKGLLGKRLAAANIPELEPQVQRALGAAVGQRAAQSTVVVRWDGIDEPIRDGTLNPWTEDYRYGAASGLLRDPAGRWTLTGSRFAAALDLLEPLDDRLPWIDELVEAAKATPPSVPAEYKGNELAAQVEALSKQDNSERYRWLDFKQRLTIT